MKIILTTDCTTDSVTIPRYALLTLDKAAYDEIITRVAHVNAARALDENASTIIYQNPRGLAFFGEKHYCPAEEDDEYEEYDQDSDSELEDVVLQAIDEDYSWLAPDDFSPKELVCKYNSITVTRDYIYFSATEADMDTHFETVTIFVSELESWKDKFVE